MTSERDKGIIRTSYVGIAGNLILTAFKLLVGILANSIAIILDAVNNATDALSSIITIVGTKLAARRPDRKHPFGYGRVEYMTSVAIAIIILAAGVISMRESIMKLIWPSDPDYQLTTIIVIVAAIIVKVGIGIYFKRRGDALNSQAVRASGIDSDYDAVLSAGTLVAAFAMMLWHVNIDGIVGTIISVFVLKAGFDILRDAVDPIIGVRGDDALGREIKDFVRSFDGVEGVYDLFIDDFGPNEHIGSLHIEVADDMSARDIEKVSRRIRKAIYDKYRIILTVGIYAMNTTGEFAPLKKRLLEIAKDYPAILEVHGFYVDEATNTVDFDMVIDFNADDEGIRDQVTSALQKDFPDYTYNVVVDTDYLD